MKNLSSILLIDSESTSFERTNLFRELPSKFWLGHEKKGVKVGIHRMQNEGQTGEENVKLSWKQNRPCPCHNLSESLSWTFADFSKTGPIQQNRNPEVPFCKLRAILWPKVGIILVPPLRSFHSLKRVISPIASSFKPL